MTKQLQLFPRRQSWLRTADGVVRKWAPLFIVSSFNLAGSAVCQAIQLVYGNKVEIFRANLPTGFNLVHVNQVTVDRLPDYYVVMLGGRHTFCIKRPGSNRLTPEHTLSDSEESGGCASNNVLLVDGSGGAVGGAFYSKAGSVGVFPRFDSGTLLSGYPESDSLLPIPVGVYEHVLEVSGEWYRLTMEFENSVLTLSLVGRYAWNDDTHYRARFELQQ